jgi:hypothetical protein
VIGCSSGSLFFRISILRISFSRNFHLGIMIHRDKKQGARRTRKRIRDPSTPLRMTRYVGGCRDRPAADALSLSLPRPLRCLAREESRIRDSSRATESRTRAREGQHGERDRARSQSDWGGPPRPLSPLTSESRCSACHPERALRESKDPEPITQAGYRRVESRLRGSAVLELVGTKDTIRTSIRLEDHRGDGIKGCSVDAQHA